MISDSSRNLIAMQFNLIHDSVRSLAYFRYIVTKKHDKTGWIYTKDVFAEHVIVSWAKVFGTYREQTHWSKLSAISEITTITKPFETENILSAVDMNIDEWNSYHSKMLTARNEFFAHFDMRSMTLRFPELEPALGAALAYRAWLSELLNAAISKGYLAINKAVPNELLQRQFQDEAESAFRLSNP